LTDSTTPAWQLGPVRDPLVHDVSRRIDVLRIILIGLIVLAHGGLGLLTPESPPPGPLTRLVLDALNLRLDSVAVPLFFTISGFLFLRKADLSVSAYAEVLRRKCLSLAIPYVLFNLVVMAYFYFLGSIFLVGSWGFVLKEGFFAKLFGLGTMPINSPLWFLRDLLVVFLFSPVLLAFFKYAPRAGLVLLGLAWLAGSANPYSYFGECFFFYLGGYAARSRLSLAGVSWWQHAGFWSLIGLTAVLVHFMPLGITDGRFFALPNKLYMAVGVVFFWRLSAFPAIRDNAALHRSARHSFFIYLAHEPVISLFQERLLAVWRPVGDFQQIACYLVSGLGTIVVLWGVAELLSRYLPRTYGLLTGAWRLTRKPAATAAVSLNR
jgi:peptidoglycan/LPS O-acetylase OafA/YrhL